MATRFRQRPLAQAFGEELRETMMPYQSLVDSVASPARLFRRNASERDQTVGQGKRSDSCAQAGDLSLQERRSDARPGLG